MDDLDYRLISALRADARRSVSDLAAELGVSRATVRARMDRLERSGEILGYTVALRGDLRELPVRAVTFLSIAGRRADAVARAIAAMPEARAVHTTNGRWDLVVEIATPDLAGFDEALRRIRLIDGVSGTETSLLLTTRKQLRA